MRFSRGNVRMSDHAIFEHAFGAALAGQASVWSTDPRIRRALTIHRNTSHKAAQDALAANYPVIVQLVGEEAFAACAAAFVEERPPAEPRLCLYGDGFGDFLRDYAPFVELGWLGNVAALERLVVETMFAADHCVFDGAALDLESALPLHAATRIGRLSGPAVSIWRAHQPDGDPDALASLEWIDEIALVTRPAGSVMVTSIDAIAADFLDSCNAGRALGEAASMAVENGADLTALFAVLIGAGAFAAIDSGD